MSKVSPYHSSNPTDPDVYHVRDNCPSGSRSPRRIASQARETTDSARPATRWADHANTTTQRGGDWHGKG